MLSRKALVTFLLTFTVAAVTAQPAELPTKFSLDTSLENSSPLNKWEQGMDLLGRVGDAWRFGRGRFVNSAILTRNAIAERAQEFASETRNNVASVIEVKKGILAQGSEAIESFASAAPFENFFPPVTRETVRLENEDSQSLAERQKPNPIGQLLENYLKPTPLVDKIEEAEKYGNVGDKFIGIGRVLVGSLEGLSNFLNAIVEFPIDTAKKTSRGVTEVLNQLGGRLVGLQ